MARYNNMAYDPDEKKKQTSAANNDRAAKSSRSGGSSGVKPIGISTGSPSAKPIGISTESPSAKPIGIWTGDSGDEQIGSWNGKPHVGPTGTEYYPVLGDDGRYYYSDPVNHYDSYDSGADAALLSEESNALIQMYKEQWLAAQAAGDQAGMDAAHAAAEAVRAKAGYSGGANGGAYNQLWKNENPWSWAALGSGGGGGGGGGSFGYTSAPTYASKYQDQIDALTQDLLNSAGKDKFTYEDAPTYSSRYQGQIDALSGQIMNRSPFSYDAESDPAYQQYRDSYTRSGQRAMQDTLGQVSARTGGLASSYAGSAAQQTYDNYMSALADKVPELRQLAYQMYLDDWNGKLNDLQILQNMEASDYNRYLTELGQYNADRNFNYGAYRDERADRWNGLDALIGLEQLDYNKYLDQLGQYNTDRNFDYGVYRDQVGDSRYADETAYSRAQYADQTAYERAKYADETAYSRGVYADETGYNRGIYEDETAYNRGLARAQQLAQTGDFSGYKDLGYSDEEVGRMQAAFLIQHPEYAALYQTGENGVNMGSYLGVDSMGNTIYYNNGVGTYSDGTPYTSGPLVYSGGGWNFNGYGGGTDGNTGGSTWNKWADVEDWAAKYGSDAVNDYLGEHYKDLGYKSKSTAVSGWKNHLVETGGSAAGSGRSTGSGGSYTAAGTSSAYGNIGTGTGGGSTGAESKTASYGGDPSSLGIGPVSYSDLSNMVNQGKVEVYTDKNGALKYRWANGYSKSNYNK